MLWGSLKDELSLGLQMMMMMMMMIMMMIVLCFQMIIAHLHPVSMEQHVMTICTIFHVHALKDTQE